MVMNEIDTCIIGLIRPCLISLILAPFAQTKWFTHIFVDCNRFNKGEINEVRIEWTLKQCRNKRRMDKTRTKLTETTLIPPTSIHKNKTKH